MSLPTRIAYICARVYKVRRCHRAMAAATRALLRSKARLAAIVQISRSPEFVGRVLFVECKSRSGKLSPAQAALKHHAEKLGHAVHVVRSLEEFLKLL